jgi:Uma2 family endonuclease
MTRHMTLEEFLALPETVPYCELIDGEVVQKPVGSKQHASAQWNLTLLLGTHPKTRRGRGYTEVGYNFPDALRPNHRVPDLSYYLPGREPGGDKYPEHMPDLAVEVLSDGQGREGQRARLAFLRARGVPCTMLIDPARRTIEVHDGDREWVAANDDEVAPDALPGFSFRVSQLFE